MIEINLILLLILFMYFVAADRNVLMSLAEQVMSTGWQAFAPSQVMSQQTNPPGPYNTDRIVPQKRPTLVEGDEIA
jgi:hypothetical protein